MGSATLDNLESGFDIYVIGGERLSRPNLEEWERGVAGLVIKVTVDKAGFRSSRVEFRYESKSDVLPTGRHSVVFKAGSRNDDRLLLCTLTEVLEYDLGQSQIIRSVSLPSFNDLHHVIRAENDTIIAVSTGLDMAVQLDWDGQVIEEWPALEDKPIWEKFSKDIDYRKVPTTKPHASHPNFIAKSDTGLWLTRFDQQDAVNLFNPQQTIPVRAGNPHDGFITNNGRHYFTTTNGHVVGITYGNSIPDIELSLLDVIKPDRPLGWCRGLMIIEDRYAIIGFSRLRHTGIQRNIRWVKDQIKREFNVGDPSTLTPLPTRISCIDLEEKSCLWTIDLEEHGLSEIFSIL